MDMLANRSSADSRLPSHLALRVTAVWIAIFWIAVFLGCTKSSAPSESQVAAKPAPAISDSSSSEDPNAMVVRARIALENGDQNLAADLLRDVCRSESFKELSHVRQAMAALMAVGRIIDCMELLEQALVENPREHDLRRVLFDLSSETEDRQRSIPHGRSLVRSRQFDLSLLVSLSNSEQRTESTSPLIELNRRNPDDKRPLTAVAKTLFELGEVEKAVDLLREIIDRWPDHAPATAMLCRVLVAANRFDDFIALASKLPETAAGHGVKAYPDYWLAVGDWAQATGKRTEATRAYWEATRCGNDVREAWLKLSTSLKQSDVGLVTGATGLDDSTMDAVERRVLLLTQFSQLKVQLAKSPTSARASAIELAQTLQKLGRTWEAEAWASIAMTLPDDDSVAAQATRQSIVASLRRDTPWQDIESHPELQIDLSGLPLPTLLSSGDRLDQEPSTTMTEGKSTIATEGNPTGIRLLDEAALRGLRFFGRTADDLQEPGVMFFQTVGCGGGAIDYDLDGWTDLCLAAAGGIPPLQDSATNALMRNLSGTFSDVSAISGTGDRGFSQGIAVGDVNEDGFPDLLVLNYGPNSLYVNNGDGTFVNASKRMGESENQSTWSSSGAIADIDGDGVADMVIVNYCDGMAPVTQTCPDPNTQIMRACAPVMFTGAADRFLQGTGDGDFVDRTSTWDASPWVVGRGLGVTVGSFDEEPGVDVFITNDMTSNHYWNHSSSGDPETSTDFRLHESATLRGLGSNGRAVAQGSMGIAVADFNGDGGIDFYVTNFLNESNTYHERQTPGIWRDQTAAYQLETPTLPLVGFGTQAVDLDNDSDIELVVSNGHVDSYPSHGRPTSYAQPMQVFQLHSRDQDTPTTGFESIAEAIGGPYLVSTHIGRALWTLDANNDGMTDLVVTHQSEPVALLINHTEQPGNGITLKLIGRECSRDAIGAIVELRSGQHRWTAPQTAGDGFLCSNERVLRFGLDDAAADIEVSVTWPDGHQQTFNGLTAGTQWLLVQDDGQPFQMQKCR